MLTVLMALCVGNGCFEMPRSDAAKTTDLVVHGYLRGVWRGVDINKLSNEAKASVDGWGRPLVSVVENGCLIVRSSGHDGAIGTPDDVYINSCESRQ
jgi:hypothetical protein